MGPNGYYDGGSRVPYRAGMQAPCGLMPFYANSSASWMPYNWGPDGEYCYLLNHTAPALPTNPAHNTTDPILCVCQNYNLCGCDNTGDSYQIPSTVKYSIINGTEYAIVNGTLENGTTAPAQSSAESLGVSVEAPLLSVIACALLLVWPTFCWTE